MHKLLSVKNLSIKIKDIYPVNDVSFDLNKGEVLTLLGESGCGKSMTALSITRLLVSYAKYSVNSKIFFKEENLLELSELEMQKMRGKKISMVFQDPMVFLNPVLNIMQQIEEVLLLHTDLNKEERKNKVIKLLKEVKLNGVEEILYKYPHELSGGMKQRVLIAIAIACSPDLLIADEPTTALDASIRDEILDLLLELQKKNDMSMLFITHDLDCARKISDSIIVMYAGRVFEKIDGNFLEGVKNPYSQALFKTIPKQNNKNFYLNDIKGEVPKLTGDLKGCRFYNRCSYAQDMCKSSEPMLKKIDNNHYTRCFFDNLEFHKEEKKQFSSSNKESKVILKLSGVTVAYPIKSKILRRVIDYNKVIDNIDLELQSGKTVALLGESGSGKTTIAKAIVGLIPIKAGDIFFDNVNVTKKINSYRKNIQMIFQDPYASLNPKYKVSEILEEALIVQSKDNQPKRKEKVLEILQKVGLPKDAKEYYPHEFSGGQRQRISIARALILKPKIIICDEPTSALDVSIQARILNLLKELQEEYNLSYLFISHDLNVVNYLADEIYSVISGKIIKH